MADDSAGRSTYSWGAFFPFSSKALASLPANTQRPVRYTREDDIPDTDHDVNGERPTIRDYHAINSVPSQIRIPKKVEGKVWFANERTWIAWLNTAILIGTLALALFNASEEPIYGFALYQSRVSMIRKRDPGHYDAIVGPVVVSVLLFFAVLANFIIRGTRQQKVPIPGMSYLYPHASVIGG
ncbi:hypothetical protein BKA83DRAFT_4252830, partial [Pisolithus microcarpus]